MLIRTLVRALLLFVAALSGNAYAQPLIEKVSALVPHLTLRAFAARTAFITHPTLSAYELENEVNAAFNELLPYLKNPAELPRIKSRLTALEAVVGSLAEVPHWEMHGLLSAVARLENNEERQLYHRAFRVALVDQFQKSGDGKSPETAFVVVNLREENVWMYLNEPHFKPKSRTSRDIGNRKYDVWTATTTAGEEQTIYFDLSLMQVSAERLRRSRVRPP